MRREHKLITFFIFVILVFVLGVVGYFILKPQTVIQSQLSDRGKEFISKQEGEFENLNLTPKEKRVNEKIEVENCFSFTFPFELTTSREQEECNWIYNFENPLGRVVMRLREVNINNLNDLPDVKLRMTRNNEYEMKQETLNGNEYFIFEKTENGYELSAFSLSNGKVLSVSLTSQINRQMQDEFKSLLQSLTPVF